MDIKEVKHQFMTYRNGIVADALRKAGMPYNIIFGLQIPQLGAIARQCAPDHQLALQLWADKGVRESRLLAAWLFDPSLLGEDDALALATSVQTREEADILCFRLLRRLPCAPELALRLAADDNEKARYCGEALTRNLT